MIINPTRRDLLKYGGGLALANKLRAQAIPFPGPGGVSSSKLNLTDTFIRPDESPLTTNWTVRIGTINLTSHKAIGANTGAGSHASWTGNSFGADQSSNITIGVFDYIDATVRNASGATVTYYGAEVDPTGLTITLYKAVAGTFTNLTAPVASACVTGDTILISAVGNQISCVFTESGVPHATIGPITDNSIATGAPGMQIFGDAATVTAWTGKEL